MKLPLTLEIDYELSDKITTASLLSVLDTLEKDLEKRVKNEGGAIFVSEKEFDIILIEKHIEASKLILKYYGYEG